MRSKKLPLLAFAACLLSLQGQAQELKSNYIKWWPSDNTQIYDAVNTWSTTHKLTEDDNFFISRVKPKTRFRNQKTQVDKNITAENDKRLIAWFPINDPGKNALPDGIFDSEVFSMWNYISHWGNWTAPLGRIPAALLDVAHKNGVAVSSVWGIPYGSPGNEWINRITTLANTDVKKTAKYMHYYGQDGLGYNSEFFSESSVVTNLTNFHVNLVKAMKDKNPIFENMWYDGTNEYGNITFDNGLGIHNDDIFGNKDNVGSSLFFNYNWTRASLLSSSVDKAKSMQRDPLYLYAGINMQGGEPHATPRWTRLKDYQISIGLWGAHSRNMFWESRNEKGSSPDIQQRTYLRRIERWFTGSTGNPANSPELNNSLNYGVDAGEFGGMSRMMTAKSTLAWNLDDEPFITYFNLGNGKFFNWEGKRQHNRSWYNIGVQDYLPTWRWWFSTGILNTTVPENGLKAEFVWTDAYMGGSCARIYGNTVSEFLHLFKTEYVLKQGDVITIKYKHAGGTANAKLVLTAKDAETTPIAEGNMALLTTTDVANDEAWLEHKITVGSALADKTLALIALQFENAENLNFMLGEVSITRGTSTTPKKPVIIAQEVLAFNQAGVDAKIIFNMENNKQADEPCYNSDVNTSLFKLWAEQQNGKRTLMGVTTSWAGMMYAIPMDVNAPSTKVRLGVSAVSLDMKSESEIAWTEYLDTPQYVYSNDVKIDKNVIKPNEAFTMSYVDPKHDEATWKLTDESGTQVFEQTGKTVTVESGLEKTGSYDLAVVGKVYKENGTSTDETVKYPNFLSITGEEIGALPQILSFKANNKDADISVNVNENIDLTYTGRKADGKLSRGLNLAEKGLVFKAGDAQLTSNNSAWTLSFWLKFNSIAERATQFLDMRHQGTGWPQNNWGCFWSTYDPDSKVLEFCIREHNFNGSPEHKQVWDIEFKPNVWTHFTVAMEKNSTGVREIIYVNGKQAVAKSYVYGNSSGQGLCPLYMNTRAWWDEAYMMLGLGRHQCASIDGVVDDVKFFNRTLTENEVEAVMKETNPAGHNPVTAWNFETNANADNWFASNAGTASVNTARAEIVTGTGEGQGSYRALEPKYMPGSPFAPGEAYVVETTPSWSAPKGSLSDMTGNSESGSAKVKYAEDGEYKVTLTLANSYGSDSKIFQVITVGTGSAIEDVTASELRTYAIDKDLFVEFTEAGNYGVQVFTQNGMLVANTVNNVTAGEKVHVQVNTSGVYILKVVKDGKTVRSAKLLCK